MKISYPYSFCYLLKPLQKVALQLKLLTHMYIYYAQAISLAFKIFSSFFVKCGEASTSTSNKCVARENLGLCPASPYSEQVGGGRTGMAR